MSVLLEHTEFRCRIFNRSPDIRWGIFGEFPNFLKICTDDFSQNLTEFKEGGHRQNLEV